jgi:hypothetical protein
MTKHNPCFDYNVLESVTSDYKFHEGKVSYYNNIGDDNHIIHKIAQASNDKTMLCTGILEVFDDYEAVMFKMQHNEFLNPDAASKYYRIELEGVYANIDFDTLLAGCPLVTEYVNRATTRRTDSKYVTKMAKSIYEMSQSIDKLNGALGDDFEEKMKELGLLANTRIEEYRINVKKTASKLAKERATIRGRMAQFLAKE